MGWVAAVPAGDRRRSRAGGPRGAGRHVGAEVQFDGELGRDEVASALQRGLALVVPSRYAEALGLVALEGMAAGAITVVTEIGGLRMLVKDTETGFTVPPRGPGRPARGNPTGAGRRVVARRWGADAPTRVCRRGRA